MHGNALIQNDSGNLMKIHIVFLLTLIGQLSKGNTIVNNFSASLRLCGKKKAAS
jgi:hypothetical protein